MWKIHGESCSLDNIGYLFFSSCFGGKMIDNCAWLLLVRQRFGITVCSGPNHRWWKLNQILSHSKFQSFDF